MVDHPFRTAATAESGVYDDTLLEAGVKRTLFVLAVDEELGDYEFTTGEIPLAVAWARTGFAYYYDSTDATTPDDGLTTLVTGNGLRFAVEDAASISLNSVLSTATVPTGAEVVGDAYIVGVGTGAFAGQDDNLAYLTRRGWVFAVPEIGATVLNEATGQNTQFTDTGWGAFAVTFADGSIAPKALQFPGGIVVEDTLNTPPGSPTTGKFWIVGSVPTGAFVGHGADLAYWTGSAWAFMDPADGWTVFHKANGFLVSYISGSWLGGAGSDYQEFSTAGSFSWTKPAKGTRVLIECIGGGGSGGRGGSGDGGGGGGGGSFVSRTMPLSAVSSTETVTVGAGGAAQTSDNADGQAGGTSSFGSHVSAPGGGGGAGNVSAAGGGGGGGGQGGAGSSSAGGGAAATAGGAGGVDLAGGTGGTAGTVGIGTSGGNGGSSGNGSSGGGGGGGSDGGGSGLGGDGGSSIFGGGGGGGGVPTSDAGNGGRSGYGGGGGGGGDGGGAIGAKSLGGASAFGGSGGNGATGSNNATAGAQPGGGGGGSVTGNSGKGGDGRVRVTVF